MKRLNKQQQIKFILNLNKLFQENKSMLIEFYKNGTQNYSRQQIYTLIKRNEETINNNIIKLFEK